MKLTVNAEEFKDMVARAVKGIGNNKLIPLTSLMAIEVKNNVCRLITTDATNYLYVINDKVSADDFYVVVDANVFSKLISKVTCATISLRIDSELKYLEVKGNGTYKIELPLDENGLPIKYPDPLTAFNFSKADSKCVVNRSTLQVILETIKPALATTYEELCYTGYYIGDKVVATDTYKIASMDVELFSEAKLISPEFLDLTSVIREEKIDVYVTGEDIVFNTPGCTIVGKLMEGIEDYSIDAISNLLKTEFNSFCAVSKSALMQVLDRILLFVGTYDKNAIYLTFTQDGLQISSKAASGVELIEYVASDNFKDYTCPIDIQMFISEVKSIQNDRIEIYYGEDNSIKLTDGNITIIIALLESDEA